MFVMNEELLSKYQNDINYANADNMFDALERLVNRYGRDFILEKYHLTEVDCVKSYVVRSNAIKCACDSIEHYIKAMLIQDGHTWDESKSLGHGLLALYSKYFQVF